MSEPGQVDYMTYTGFLLRFLKGGKKIPTAGTWSDRGLEPEVSVVFDERKCSNH